MLAEDLTKLLPGAGLGSGIGEAIYPANPPIPPYGSKMPAEKRTETNKKIQAAQDAKQQEADQTPFFHYLGLGGTWSDVGVYGILFVLFVIGVIGLLLAAGNSSPIKEVTKLVKKG